MHTVGSIQTEALSRLSSLYTREEARSLVRILLEEILLIKGRIRATLAEYLHNGNIKVDFRLVLHDEIKPMLTPHQELKKLKQNYKSVQTLIDSLDLDLV